MACNWKKCCCFCCILMIVFVVALGVAVIVVREYSPKREIKYEVADASLTQFNLTSDKILKFNLAVTINVQNPNRRSDFHYEKFEAIASYKHDSLMSVSIDPFEVEHRDKYPVSALFKGEQKMSLPNDEVSKMKTSTVYDIVLKLKVKHWAKYATIKIHENMKMACNLKVPLNSNGKSAVKFEVAKCEKA